MPKERKSRRSRVDSKESAVQAMMSSTKDISPPDDLKISNHGVVIFHEIIGEFAKVDWTPHTIRLAGNLAKCMSRLEDAQEEMDGDSLTVINAKGTPMANPLVSVINSLTGQVLSLRRALALHAMAGNVGKRDIQRRAAINKKNEGDSPLGDDEDDLIATPAHG